MYLNQLNFLERDDLMSGADWDDSTVLGAGDQLLPDGRELHYEAWCECGYTFLTYLFPIT